MRQHRALAAGLRLLLFAAATVVVACNGSTTAPAPPPVPPTAVPTSTGSPAAYIAGHLYVSTASVPSAGSIVRYPLLNGVPGNTPDLGYPQNAYPPFSVRRDGSLYSFSYPGSSFVLNSFTPNSPTPASALTLPTVFGTYYSALTVDRQGYVYAENTFVSSIRSRGEHTNDLAPHPLASSTCSPSSEPYGGFLVYAPQASGSQDPIQCFYSANTSQYNGTAVDSHGTLYVPQSSLPATISEIGTPLTHPHVIRTLKSSSFYSITGVALDGDDRLWVLNSNGFGLTSSSSVQNFAPYANGGVEPAGTIAYPTRQLWFGNVAVDDKYLYIGGDGAVLVYPKTAKGKKAPLATLPVGSLSGFGDGPYVAVSQ